MDVSFTLPTIVDILAWVVILCAIFGRLISPWTQVDMAVKSEAEKLAYSISRFAGLVFTAWAVVHVWCAS